MINKPWISRKNDKALKNMIKTQILLRKTIESNRSLRVTVSVRVRFLLFYFELAPTDPWCKMLRDFTWTKKIWGGNVIWTPSSSILTVSTVYIEMLTILMTSQVHREVRLRNDHDFCRHKLRVLVLLTEHQITLNSMFFKKKCLSVSYSLSPSCSFWLVPKRKSLAAFKWGIGNELSESNLYEWKRRI